MYFKYINGNLVECEKSELVIGERFMKTFGNSKLASIWGGESAELKTSISRREFWQRVGDVKYSELLDISESDNLLKARLDIINADQNVWLDSPEYTNWFNELVSKSIITQEEYDLIFKK